MTRITDDDWHAAVGFRRRDLDAHGHYSGYPRYNRPLAAMDDLAHRLAWAHGENRAASIMRGEDSDTENDIAAWRMLGLL